MENINTLFGVQTVKAERTEETIYLDPANLLKDSTGHVWERKALSAGIRIVNPEKITEAGLYQGIKEGRSFTISGVDSPGLFD